MKLRKKLGIKMDNYLLMEYSKELEQYSKELGFNKTFFKNDFVIIKEDDKRKLLKLINKIKQKIIYVPRTEEMARFALEKTKVDMVIGIEKINPKDSVHYVRGGLDQITCKIARDKGKKIVFSFSDILNAKKRERLLARMKLNLKLCKKYKVDVVFSNFSSSKETMRSRKDLEAFLRVVGK